MKDRIILSIFIIVTALLHISCGGGSGDNEEPSIPFSYDCSVFPNQATSEIILPYEIGSSFVSYPHAAQTPLPAPNSTPSGQYYAVDMIMPIGSPIVASKAGTVVRVEEGYVDGDNQLGHENFLIVAHSDGTFSRYFHLMNEGALVDVGDPILQLQIIASSGHTGNSTEPHLHFDIVDEFCDPNSDINNELRNCQTLPVTFRNTRLLECGLEWGESYTALSF